MSEPTNAHTDLVAAARAHARQGTCWAWELIARGLEYHQLDPDDLSNLVAHLRQGRSWTSGELSFEVEDDQVVRVSLLDEHQTCSRDHLVDQLMRLSDTE